ncbi:MAG: hypothetical protein ABIH56_04440 [Candidatus Margulisiibacteriota bacterium]
MMLEGFIIIGVICATVAIEAKDLKLSIYALGGVGACLALVFLTFESYFFSAFQFAVVSAIVYILLLAQKRQKIFEDDQPRSSVWHYLTVLTFAGLAGTAFFPVLTALPGPIQVKYTESLRTFDVVGMIIVVCVAAIAIFSLFISRKHNGDIK